MRSHCSANSGAVKRHCQEGRRPQDTRDLKKCGRFGEEHVLKRCVCRGRCSVCEDVGLHKFPRGVGSFWASQTHVQTDCCFKILILYTVCSCCQNECSFGVSSTAHPSHLLSQTPEGRPTGARAQVVLGLSEVDTPGPGLAVGEMQASTLGR